MWSAADQSWWPWCLPGLTTLGGLEKLIELLLIGLVAKEFVKFGASLHEAEHTALRTFVPDGMVHLEGGGVHRTVGGAAIEDDVDPGGGQLLRGVEGSLPKLGDIGQDGHARRLFEAGVHGQNGDGFGKNHIRTGRN